MTAERDPILVWGAGAVGGTIGAYLARAGHEVVMVDVVADHVAAIRDRGLAIEGPIAEFTQRVAAAVTPEQLEGRFRRCILGVKAQDTAAAAAALRGFVADDGYVVSAQNGLNERTISEIVGRDRTIGAFVNFGADYLGPGRIVYGGRGAVVVGELDGKITPRLTALRDLLHDFEPAAIATDNIWGYLWGKLAYGALLFATALTNDSIADALALPEHAGLYRALGGEVLGLAAAERVRPEAFNGFDPEAFRAGAELAATRRSIDAMVAHNRRSAKSHSGIWRDLAVRKRRTEVDAQIAILVDIAAGHGLRVPVIERLVQLIHAIEDGARPMQRDNLDALAEPVAIRAIAPGDLPGILALNNAHAAEVNELSGDALAALVAVSAHARAIGAGQAFLIALDERTPAQGPNHAWFVARYPAFLYIDRVVVAAASRGMGHARRLYDDLAAIAGGRPLCCEVNLVPPNPASMAFHERLGFAPCGEGDDPRNGKRVRYLIRRPG